MINQAYRLIAPKQIRADFVDLKMDDENIIVRPTYLSICAADHWKSWTSDNEAKITYGIDS